MQNRQFSLTLSEQFTGGLLALQLFLAQVLHCWRVEVVPSQEETGANCALDYRTAGQPFCRAGTGCFGFRERTSQLCASHTRRSTFALRVRFSTTRYWLAIRQEVCAMMALNMLRRWLNGRDIASEHGWIEGY